MSIAASTCRPRAEIDAHDTDSTGLLAQDEDSVAGRQHRPGSAWVTDELLAQTIEVWSRNYGRPVDEREALEILMNVKRLAEALIEARKEEACR